MFSDLENDPPAIDRLRIDIVENPGNTGDIVELNIDDRALHSDYSSWLQICRIHSVLDYSVTPGAPSLHTPTAFQKPSSFPRKRESTHPILLDPRFRGDDIPSVGPVATGPYVYITII
jgi:hypothetical protein